MLLVDDRFDDQLLRAVQRIVELRGAPLQMFGKQVDRPEQIDRRVRVGNFPEGRLGALLGLRRCRRADEKSGKAECAKRAPEEGFQHLFKSLSMRRSHGGLTAAS